MISPSPMKSPDRDAADELGHCLAYHTDAYGTTFVPRTVIERVIADWSELATLRRRVAEMHAVLEIARELCEAPVPTVTMIADLRKAGKTYALSFQDKPSPLPPGRNEG